MVLNMLDAGAWERLCRALGRQDWLEDERFDTPKNRYRRMPELVAAIDDVLSARTRDEWGSIFDDHGVIWGPVLSLHEVPDDPQAQALGLFPSVEHPGLGAYRTVSVPIRSATAEVKPRGPAPALGEHTREVLSALGYGNDDIQRLYDNSIVA